MALIEIGNTRVLYTGDYSREPDRHLPMAEIPSGLPPDVLIVESTFGIRTHEARDARESRLLSTVRRVVERGGHVLMPLSAFGRAQELMLMLDDYWAEHPHLHRIPIYYAAPMAIKALQLYKAFSSYMTRSLQARMGGRNPWDFRHIRPLRDARTLPDGVPCVVIAAPGMLQGGVSRTLFERWCANPADAVVVAGYCVEGTLAKDILRKPGEITSSTGRKLALNCDVEEVQFAAHADYAQTSDLVETLKPQTIVLVHGEATEMRRLHQALVKRTRDGSDTLRAVFMPPNKSTVRRVFRQDRSGKAIGLMAEASFEPGRRVSGVLVRRGFGLTMVSDSELPRFTPLQHTPVNHALSVPFRSPWRVARHYIASVFDDVIDVLPAVVSDAEGAAEVASPSDAPACGKPSERSLSAIVAAAAEGQAALLVSGVVRVVRASKSSVRLEWGHGDAADLVADTLVAVLAQAEFSPMALAETLVDCCPPAPALPEAAVAAAIAMPSSRHRFCPPSCSPAGAASSSPQAQLAASLPPHLAAVLGDVEPLPTVRPEASAAASASNPVPASALQDPLGFSLASAAATSVDAAAFAPLQAWRTKRREEAQQRAGAMLVAVLREWFGPSAVAVEAAVTTVRGDDDAVVDVDVSALTLSPAAGAPESAAQTSLQETIRFAIAHCREVCLGPI